MDDDDTKAEMSQGTGYIPRIPDLDQASKRETADASASELFDLYEKVAETRPGTRDAEIFEKIREWSFSDFSVAPYEFAGITKEQLDAWQKRNRINLSAGHIRPDPIDIARGHAWSQIRIAASVNRLHSNVGPPSAHEIRSGHLVPAGRSAH